MIRYEVKTKHKSFVGCESTLAEAKAYIRTCIENGLEVISARFYDNERRVADIMAGREAESKCLGVIAKVPA
jgi:hypothetical protein